MEQGAEVDRLVDFTALRLHERRRMLGWRPVLRWLVSHFNHFSAALLILNLIVTFNLFHRQVVPHAGEGHGEVDELAT